MEPSQGKKSYFYGGFVQFGENLNLNRMILKVFTAKTNCGEILAVMGPSGYGNKLFSVSSQNKAP